MKKCGLKELTASVCSALLIFSVGSFSEVTADDIEFDEIPVLSELKGDINRDFSVTAADLFAFRYYLHGDLVISDMKNADMDDNGKTDILDYILMKNAIIENEK